MAECLTGSKTGVVLSRSTYPRIGSMIWLDLHKFVTVKDLTLIQAAPIAVLPFCDRGADSRLELCLCRANQTL